MDLRHVQPGDTLVLRDVNEARQGGPQRVQVLSVGRLNLKVAGYRLPPFCRETGRAKDEWGHKWLQTVEAHEDEKQRRPALARLNTLGVTAIGCPTAFIVALADAAERIAKEMA